MSPLAFALLLSVSIAVAVGSALAWLLAGETKTTLLALAAICALSLAVHVVSLDDYPPGLNEDEPHALLCADRMLRAGKLFGEGCTGPPVLLAALFEAQLTPLIGANRRTMRGYSLLTMVLASAALFAAARALGLGTAASLAGAALLGAMPWSLLYGRVHQGGELILHQLLLLAALARLIPAQGGWREVAIGTVGLALLLYDYFAGRAMLAMPLIAALLARGYRARALCAAVLVASLIAWSPYIAQRPHNLTGGAVSHVAEGYSTRPVSTALDRTGMTVRALATPTAGKGWLAIRTGAMHPMLVLALALIGGLRGPPRRVLFLWLGFVAGIAPCIIGTHVSSHRLLMAYPFIPLAAACALDPLARRRWGAPAMAVLTVLAAGAGVRLFFSADFWPADTDQVFERENTALMDSIPPPPRPQVVVDRLFGHFMYRLYLEPHNAELLTAERWIPRNGERSLYLFSKHAHWLRSFYERLVPGRVRCFGRAFIVDLEAADWSWMKRHGWTHRGICGNRSAHVLVPTLIQPQILPAAMTYAVRDCGDRELYSWDGRWVGPPADLRMRFSGRLVIEAEDAPPIERSGYETSVDFSVTTGQSLRVRLTPHHTLVVQAMLMERTVGGERAPAWEWVDPLDPP